MNKFVKYLMALALVAAIPAFAGEEKAKCSAECAKACCDDAKGLKQLTYKVGGADCEQSCAAIDKVFTKIDGVSKAGTCSESHLTSLTYDPKKIKPEQILAAIKKAGYKVEGQQLTIPVKDMACGACSAKVGKALTKLDGVKEGAACHKSKHAVVLFDPFKVKPEQIVATINSTGFKVVEDAPKAN